MRIEPKGNPDLAWEDDGRRFRVRFHCQREGSLTVATSTYDLAETDVLEALVWAQKHAAEHTTYDVSLVWQDPQRGPGLVQLFSNEDDLAEDPPEAERPPALHLVEDRAEPELP